MAYPQADISMSHVYMEIPIGFELEGGRETHCLHVLKNIYGDLESAPSKMIKRVGIRAFGIR
jgi:hypothetical protein